METRSAKSSKELSLKNGHLAHPGSAKRLDARKSFRTPVQTLPLSNEKSASRSYVVPAKQEDNETPRTLIAGLLESAQTQPVITRALKRRSSIVSQSPKPQKEFKSPRLSDILAKNLRKLKPQTASSPGSKFTPRTNIKNLLAGTELEQTPLERTSKSATEEHPPSDSIPSRVKRRESGWGQRLSISPVQVSLSLSEDDNREGATLLSAREKKIRRSFRFNKNVEAKLPKHLSKSPAVKNTLDFSQESVKASKDENVDDQDVEEIEKNSSHQSKRNSSKSVKPSPTLAQEDEQSPSQPDSSWSSIDEQEVNRPEGDTNEQTVHLSAKEKKTHESPSTISLHQGLDSGEEDDILLQQRVINNVGGIDLQNGERHGKGTHLLSATPNKLQMSRSVNDTVKQVTSVSQVLNEEDEQEGQLQEWPSQSMPSNNVIKHVNSSKTHVERGASEELLATQANVMSSSQKSLEEKRVAKSSQLNTLSRSQSRSSTDEDPENSLSALSKPNEVFKNRTMSTTLQRDSSTGMNTRASKVRMSIRNTSLLKGVDPSLPGPSVSLQGHSEYDLMESSSEAEKSLGHSKILSTPKRKSSSKALSSRSNITKDELAEKYKSPSRSPGSPYRILRQSNADFRVIGQRCSTPLLRNKSFFHSTKVQETLPQDSTHNHTHLMGDDIHNISPIRPDVRLQKQRSLDDELVDDAEPGKRNERTEKSSTSSKRSEVPQADLSRGRVTESIAREKVNQSGDKMVTDGHHGSSKGADANSQQTTVSGTKRKHTLESDSEDELPNGISPLNTPYFTTTRRPQISSAQNAPRMKQSKLINQDGVLKTTNQAQPKRAKTGEAKTTPARQSKKQKTGLTLPRSSVKFFAERHTSMKLSKDAVDEIVRVSETYWSDTWKALEAYALHAGRKKIVEEDVILLMKTQRVITGIGDLHDKIREHLPMELRAELIPLTL